MNFNMKTVAIITITVLVIVLVITYSKKYEGFEDFDNINCTYTESNLGCNLGAKKCHFSNGAYNGKSGLCNPSTKKCEYLPQWTNVKNGYPLMFPPMDTYPPIGEENPMCMWRGICDRNDGSLGFCVSSLCYPETNIIQ